MLIKRLILKLSKLLDFKLTKGLINDIVSIKAIFRKAESKLININHGSVFKLFPILVNQCVFFLPSNNSTQQIQL